MTRLTSILLASLLTGLIFSIALADPPTGRDHNERTEPPETRHETTTPPDGSVPAQLTAEQEDPDKFPTGANPRCYIFENMDGTGKNFEERVIIDNGLGFHDILIGDVDGDGDLDFCSKIWNRWPGNANGGREHLDFYENVSK